MTVHVVDPDDPGRLRPVHTRGLPDGEDLLAPVALAAELPVSRAARERAPVWVGERPVAPGAAGDEVRAVAALPLTAASAVVGALSMTFRTVRAFPPDERSFAMSLAGQAALALDRAAISDARWEIARTLQLGLLPARLPSLPGVALSARYLPAGVHTRRGG